MVRQDVNPSVATAKECAEQPAYNRNQDGTEERAPESVHFEARHDLADEFQHQRVDDQDKEAERDED